MPGSFGSLDRITFELLAERSSILFSHDTSSPDILQHVRCVRETGTGSESLRVTLYGGKSKLGSSVSLKPCYVLSSRPDIRLGRPLIDVGANKSETVDAIATFDRAVFRPRNPSLAAEPMYPLILTAPKLLAVP